VIQSLTPQPATLTHSYDPLNRLIETRLGGVVYPISYGYDAGAGQLGRLTSMTNPGAGLTVYTHDLHGRVTHKAHTIQGATRSASYGYSGGRLSSITYPSGKVVSYLRDTAGRIEEIRIDGQVRLSGIQYHPFGAPRAWSWGNGATYTRTYDLDGRLSTFKLGSAMRTLVYDEAGRIKQMLDSADPAYNRLYGHDPLDRLTGYEHGTLTETFAYDPTGNRTSRKVGATIYPYTTPATSNRLTGVAGPSARNNTYNGAGNLTADGARSYTYDQRGRLTQAVAAGNTYTYRHNGQGERVAKSGPSNIVPSGTNFFFYDEGGRLIGEYDVTGVPLTEIVYLDELPVVVLKASGYYYAHTDQVGAPRMLLKPTTGIGVQNVWAWGMDPFGTSWANEDPDGNGQPIVFNLRLPGQYFDKETGLHYNYFRDYDPQIGRYVQSDPIGLEGGANTYGYVNQNPLLFADPMGLAGVDMSCPGYFGHI